MDKFNNFKEKIECDIEFCHFENKEEFDEYFNDMAFSSGYSESELKSLDDLREYLYQSI